LVSIHTIINVSCLCTYMLIISKMSEQVKEFKCDIMGVRGVCVVFKLWGITIKVLSPYVLIISNMSAQCKGITLP